MSIETKQVIIVARPTEGSACKAVFDGDGKCVAGSETAVQKAAERGAAVVVRVRGTKGENDPSGAEHPTAKKILARWGKDSGSASDDGDSGSASDDGDSGSASDDGDSGSASDDGDSASDGSASDGGTGFDNGDDSASGGSGRNGAASTDTTATQPIKKPIKKPIKNPAKKSSKGSKAKK
jgi:hypothetical protein